MLNEAVGELLPAAVAVALSPIPIVAVVLVLHSPRARSNGLAFAAGWVAGLTAVSVIVMLIAGRANDPGSDVDTGVNWVLAAIGALFLVMAARLWKKRPRPGEAAVMPSWMTSIDSISPMRAIVLGVALSAANPKNLALTLASSAAIANAGLDGTDTVIALATFVAIGSATVVGAVAFYLAAPGTAQRPLAAVKQFMSDNNTTIMMVILVLLGAKLLGETLWLACGADGPPRPARSRLRSESPPQASFSRARFVLGSVAPVGDWSALRWLQREQHLLTYGLGKGAVVVTRCRRVKAQHGTNRHTTVCRVHTPR